MNVADLALGILATILGVLGLAFSYYMRKQDRKYGQDSGEDGPMLKLVLGAILTTFFGIVLIIYAIIGS